MASMTIKQRLAMIASGQHQDLADIVAADALKEIQRLESAIAALPADGGEVDYDTNDPMGVEKDIQSSDGGGGSRPALKEERIKTTTVHEDRTTSLAAVRQMAGAAPGPSEATTPSAREALEEIRNMTVNLRSGGPDPMDLQELSDALERATELASELLNSGGF